MANAIGIVEFVSIARGIFTADQMIKAADVEIVTASSSCPGKYIAIVHGDVAAVKEAVAIGERTAEDYFVDSMIIPNVSPELFPAISGVTMPERIQAVGIMESFSIATMILAADAILKAANVQAIELRLGNGIGGKAFFTFTGNVAAVEASIEAGKEIAEEKGLLVNAEIIPSPSDRLIQCLL
ncbi:BMC domain-containing protein [Schinkia sp. CFF1]